MKSYENLDINDLENEIWKVCYDFPDYFISNLGRIKSTKFNKEKILKQNKNKNKYLTINLCRNGKQKNKDVHILVFEIFNNYKLKNDECIHHKDKNKENNYYNNLKLMIKSNHTSVRNNIL
jgi:hypothetical protein